MGCNPRAWQTDLFQLQLYFLPSLLLNWSWLCLVLQRRLPGLCNICYISCMYSCVLTRNIKIKDGRRQGEGEVKWGNMNANHVAGSLGLPTTVHCSLDQTDFLPTDSTSPETQISPQIWKIVITNRPLNKQNNKWSPSFIFCSCCHMYEVHAKNLASCELDRVPSPLWLSLTRDNNTKTSG